MVTNQNMKIGLTCLNSWDQRFKIAGDSTYEKPKPIGCLLSLGPLAVLMSFLWLKGSVDTPMILAPQYYGINSILVMQAGKEASIQSLILISFSSSLFSYSVFLCILFQADYLGAASHKIHKIYF